MYRASNVYVSFFQVGYLCLSNIYINTRLKGRDSLYRSKKRQADNIVSPFTKNTALKKSVMFLWLRFCISYLKETLLFRISFLKETNLLFKGDHTYRIYNIGSWDVARGFCTSEERKLIPPSVFLIRVKYTAQCFLIRIKSIAIPTLTINRTTFAVYVANATHKGKKSRGLLRCAFIGKKT